MATLTHAESKRLYSWWWDSHISPKNSKWLQENLTDMDARVKAMIKLMEEDADSFAKRAEMYYRKRPELMKLIEEFYRVYRALAERYDHVTWALHQAHRTMTEAFLYRGLADDPQSGSSVAAADTPEMVHPAHVLFDTEDLHEDALELSSHFRAIKTNGAYSNNNDAITNKRGLKQLNELLASGDSADHAEFAEERARKGKKFQDGEKGFKNMEQNVSADIQKDTVEENDDTDRKTKILQTEITQLSTDTLNHTRKVLSESAHADKAEKEVESLCQTLSKLESEKEAALLQYQQCLERVSSLEAEISCGQEDFARLNREIVECATRLESAEEHLLLLEKANQSLQSEVDTLVQKASVQQQEFTNRNQELEKLIICIEDEHTHLVYTEAALQSLQSLYYQSEVDQRMLELELQQLKDMEFRKKDLEDEIQHLKEENCSLSEQNLSSAMLTKNLEDEIFSLKEAKGTLEEEAGLRIDQLNALQQKLYYLREELNNLERRHRGLIEQVESVGLNVNCLRSSTKDLQDENLKLKEICKENEYEKAKLSGKLENMEKLLESARERHKTLEVSFQSLQEEKSTLIADKCLLVSQVESSMEDIEKLSEKNDILQSSVSEVNIELEGMRAKAKGFEESFRVLLDEKSILLVERNGLLSQIETNRQCLENLGKRQAELEHNHLCLEKERETTLCSVDELQHSLNLEKQEHTMYFQSSQALLATLGSRIHILQEESKWWRRQFEEEQDKMMNAKVEIFVLQSCICDMKDRYLSLSTECSEHIEASGHANKLISELEKEILEHKMKANSLIEDNGKLKTGIQCVLKSLNIDMDDGFSDSTAREHFPLILGKIQDMNSSVLDNEDEKQQLFFELIVSSTLLEQLRLEASDLKSEKHALEWDSEGRMKELLMLQSENHELLKMNDWLRQNVYQSSHNVELLTDEVKIVRGQLLHSQEANGTLQKENCKMHEENHSLKKEIYDKRVENHALEEENNRILEEATVLSSLLLIFESISNEKAKEIKTLSDEMDRLHRVISALEEVSLMTEQVEAENLYLKESIGNFRNCSVILEDELKRVRTVSEQLNREVEIGKNMLSQKEMELSQADKKLIAVECERAELHKEVSELKLRDEQLKSALQEQSNEIELWEMEASVLYEDLQNNAICLALFEEKACELIRACRSLEENEIFQETMFYEELKEAIGELERENGGLRAELTEYLPLILSLKDSISSLEDHIHSLTKLHVTDNKKTQDPVEGHLHGFSSQGRREASDTKEPAGVVELQKLETEVQAVNKLIMEIGRLVMQGSSITNSRLKATMRELKFKNGLVQEDVVRGSKDVVFQQGEEWKSSKDVGLQNDEAEASKAKHGLMIKDIRFDHIFDSSSYKNGVVAYGIGRRGKSEADDQIPELWETAEWDLSGEPSMVHKTQNLTLSALDDMIVQHQIETVEKERNEYPLSEIQDKNLLAADTVREHKKVLESQQEGNRILERLASDARKLINLQAIMQELQRKFENFEMANQLLGFEYDDVKEQLKEVDEAILQLVDINGKLTRNVEGCYASDKAEELEERGNERRQKLSERAQSWSEKIGRLEMEVQRIQFVMLKLETEYGNEGTKAFDTRKKVLLRDYLYGLRHSSRRKRVPFYACVRPVSNG